MEAISNKIIGLLQGLSARFQEMTFTYGYDESVNQHIVEVTPTALYDSDEYMDAESEIVSAFIDVYPNEGLLFTSNNPHIRQPKPIYIAKPSTSKLASPRIEPYDMYNSLVPGQPLVYGRDGVFTVIEENGHELEAGEYNYAMAA